ncbi:superoxide dismutase family protein [Streptomyces sp. NPDC054866]
MVAGMLAGAVATAVLAAGGGSVGGNAPFYEMRVAGRFALPTASMYSWAVTYDRGLVPVGSQIEVDQRGRPNDMAVTLRVRGMKPGHAYGAHVHQKPCGTDPAAAGGHYQHRQDPVQPSEDPAYVNPKNEVWLDFTAGADGSGTATSRHDWEFRAGEARSVVLHREQGGAGERVACFTVPFLPTH